MPARNDIWKRLKGARSPLHFVVVIIIVCTESGPLAHAPAPCCLSPPALVEEADRTFN